MPELPEVETIRKGLSQNILNKKIKAIQILRKSAIRPHSPETFIKTLRGVTFLDIERYGKLLVFSTDKKDIFLLAHLKMTGQLVYEHSKLHSNILKNIRMGKGISEYSHTRLVLYFKDSSRLVFNDMRTFGFLRLVNAKEKEGFIKKGFSGIDPTSPFFTPTALRNILRASKSFLKRVLLNQTKIAGIGNIYADEICFASKLHPEKKARTLSDKDIGLLCKRAKDILRKAIRYRGTTFGKGTRGHYVDSLGRPGGFVPFLAIYKREGKHCVRCKNGIIQKGIVAGRGTRYCKICQL